MKQVEDNADAPNWLSEQAIVDPTKIAFWGMSFSGSFAACAAALDKRARYLIMVCPFVEFYTND
jgi:cephalosporin-C deacetylase-like acetyl esterase